MIKGGLFLGLLAIILIPSLGLAQVRTDQVVATDLDGDGDGDVIMVGQQGIVLYGHSSDGVFVRQQIDEQGGDEVQLLDIDGDEVMDLLITDYSSGLAEVRWYHNKGNLEFDRHIIAAEVAVNSTLSLSSSEGEVLGNVEVKAEPTIVETSPTPEPAEIHEKLMADAGADQVVERGSLVVLDGRGSRGLDSGSLNYEWRQLEGPAVIVSNNREVQPTFVVDEAGVVVFHLLVSDLQGRVDTDLVTISVKPGLVEGLSIQSSSTVSFTGKLTGLAIVGLVVFMLILVVMWRSRRIYGLVRDKSSQQPLAGMMVKFYDPKTKRLLMRSITNKHGRFYQMPASGRYVVEVMGRGYVTMKKVVSVVDDNKQCLEFDLLAVISSSVTRVGRSKRVG